MNKFFVRTALVALASAALGLSAMAQAPGPRFDAATIKIFGDNSHFSATAVFQINRPPVGQITLEGKIAMADGQTRFETDMANMKGGNIPPQAMAQMKQMGMSKMIAINCPGKNATYIIYPDMRGYVETTSKGAAPNLSDYKMTAAKLGAETVDGHSCVKNKVVVTGPDGISHESTVWNATDLRNFPVKIESESPQTGPVVMLLRDVKFSKPSASEFEPPSGFEKSDNMTSLMMKSMKSLPRH